MNAEVGLVEIIFVTIIAPIIVPIVLFFILPFFKKPRDKFTAWIQKKFTGKKKLSIQKESSIKIKRDEDLKLLEEIINPLLFINQLPRFPDTEKEDIRDKLFEIQTKARQIRSKDFNEIKIKLIQYSEKVEKFHINISLTELLKLLVRNNGAYKLVEEIREIMVINESLEKAILKQLDKKYPSTIESDGNILPEYENRNEIRNHLFDLRNKEWIESKIIEEEGSDLPVGYMYIRLTLEGKKHL